MIKIKLLICLMFVFTLQAFAQKSNLGSQPISERAKMENIKGMKVHNPRTLELSNPRTLKISHPLLTLW